MKVLPTLCTLLQIYCTLTIVDVTCTTAPTVTKLRNVYLSNLNSTNVTGVKIIPNSRTIQRLVGGHIQHHQEVDVQQQGNIGENSKKLRNSKIYFRRKPQTIHSSQALSTSSNNVYPNVFYANRDALDDAVFLNDHKIDSVNNELTSASAGAGPELSTSQTGNGTKDGNKKTLSDQIAEGKYGLIQKELFQTPPKRPGVISYAKNAEVPKDTEDNYGGLDQEDIWLAEDHLLVLKGGGLNKKDYAEPWTPIDNYQAPRRQVKIPDNPKVPPPFPVQLGDNEPIQFIGNNQFPSFNPFQNDQIYFGETQKNISFDPNKTYLPPRFRPFENLTSNNNGYKYPLPIPPSLFNNNEAFQNPFLNETGPLPPNLFPLSFPPSVPLDERNITEPFDEDDPRLYYPPPYSFEYKSNYTNPVAPGPLVPGIVLPPPPNFFGRVSNKIVKPATPTNKLVSAITEIYSQQLQPVVNKTKLYNTPQRIPTRAPPTATKSTIQYNQNNNYNNRPQFVDTPRITPSTLKPMIDENQEIVNFVSKIATKTEVLNSNKGNPIYYEYFDARQNPTHSTPGENSNQLHNNNQQTEYALNNVTPNYKQEKRIQRPQNTYLPVQQYENKFYYVTPKPDIIPNGLTNGFKTTRINVVPTVSLEPTLAPSFDQEIENLQKTIQYYNKNSNNQNQQSTQPPRTPKAQTVYDYSYNPIRESTRKPAIVTNPDIQYDTSPFKPILPFSSPYDNINGFKAIQYTQSTTEPSINPYTFIPSGQYETTQRYVQSNFHQKTLKANQIRPQQQQQQGYSTLAPLNYRQYVNYDDANPQYQYPDGIDVTENYPTTTIRNPWVTIEKHTVRELPQYPIETTTLQNTRIQRPRIRYNNNNSNNNKGNYNYNRPNNDFYSYNTDSEFTQQVNSLRTQIYKQNYSQRLIPQQPQQIQSQYPQQPQISLINDTYVNYQHPRPNINPYSEYIPPTTGQGNQYSVNQYYVQQAIQPLQQQQLPTYQEPNLHRDTAVNYKYPLPPINPNAEYISPREYRNKYKNNQQNPIIEYRLGNDQSQVYFITPRELKYNNNNSRK